MLLLVWASRCQKTTSVTHVAVVMYLFVFEEVRQPPDKKVGSFKNEYSSFNCRAVEESVMLQ